jgi:Domain of unknown function (DUF1905)/Bacteriocin-protection, YdeI or OmpD-Associated
MRERRFQGIVQPSGRGGGHLVKVPRGLVEALGGRGRIPVRATFNGVPYRGSIVPMGDGFVLGVTKAIMAEVRVRPGDRLDVAVELDDEPREVPLPEDLRSALSKRPDLAAAWDGLSFTKRKEHALSVQEAKRPETRSRRLAKLVEALE